MTKEWGKSDKDKIVFGVCGGLGKYFNLDSTLVRAIFLLLLVAKFSGLLIYLVLAIILPKLDDKFETNFSEFSNTNHKDHNMEDNNEEMGGKIISGLVLITLGILFQINMLLPKFEFGKLWPIILIVIGIGVIFVAKMKKNNNDID